MTPTRKDVGERVQLPNGQQGRLVQVDGTRARVLLTGGREWLGRLDLLELVP